MISEDRNTLTFLKLIRLGIGHTVDVMPSSVDWGEMKGLAEQQGLGALVLDGVEVLRTNGSLNESLNMPDKLFLTQWIGEVLQGYDYRYDLYRRAIGELAGFYNAREIKLMVIKGYACSVDWPRPEHRPCGDIDIWLFGQQKGADTLLEKEKRVEIDSSHHHHTVFFWHDFMVENHYDFVNVYHHKGNIRLEKEFKRLATDDTHFVEINGERVYLPSPNLHVLFLLKHTLNDFTSFSMTLRQVLDWAFHLKKHGGEIDWNWLLGILEEFHMTDFFNCLNAICVEELGFEPGIFHGVQFNPVLLSRVLDDIFYPKYSRSCPLGLLPRLAYKYKRWKGNGWKHELCYRESRWKSFWILLWSHLIKPKV